MNPPLKSPNPTRKIENCSISLPGSFPVEFILSSPIPGSLPQSSVLWINTHLFLSTSPVGSLGSLLTEWVWLISERLMSSVIH